MRRLEKDESLCIGCHQCEEACSKAFYKVSDPMKSCIRITDKEDGSHHIAVCTQCGKCSFGSMQYRCDYGGCERRLPAE